MGDCKFENSELRHIVKSLKFTLTVGNGEVLIAIVVLVFYHFFSENYYQSKGKYFAMTCFNQIQIMNFTIILVSLSPLYG